MISKTTEQKQFPIIYTLTHITQTVLAKLKHYSFCSHKKPWAENNGVVIFFLKRYLGFPYKNWW